MIDQQIGCQIGQAERIVQFPMQQQTAVRTDRRASKQQPHGTIELQQQWA